MASEQENLIELKQEFLQSDSVVDLPTQEPKPVEYKSSPFLLNKYFEIEFYNGGRDFYSSNNKEVQIILQAPSEVPEDCHSTREGFNFDLVLKFNGETDFTLTHFVIRGASNCTSVIKGTLNSRLICFWIFGLDG